MGNYKTYKIFAFIALIIELIASFVLFAKVKNMMASHDINTKEGWLLISLLLLLLATGVLFVLVLILTSQNSTNSVNKEIQFSDATDSMSDINIEDSDKNIDTENYLKKIIPKETAKFDLVVYTEKLLSNFAKEFDIVQGLFYLKEKDSEVFKNISKYAYFGEDEPQDFKTGESLSGQVAKNKTILYLDDIPDNYVTILSGLGTSSPKNLLILPIIINDVTIGILELASFKEFEKKYNEFYLALSEKIGEIISKH